MKILQIILLLLTFSITSNAQASFPFNDCLNKWSDFKPAGAGMNVRAAYISNNAGRNWCIQIMNTNAQPHTFPYTVYGSHGQFSKFITIDGHGVSPSTIVSVNGCCIYGSDIFVSCAASPTLKKQYSQLLLLEKKKNKPR